MLGIDGRGLCILAFHSIDVDFPLIYLEYKVKITLLKLRVVQKEVE